MQIDALPLTRLHLFILVVCAIGFSFDLAEIAFGGILSAIFSAPPNPIDQGQLAWLLAAVYIGAICGAPILGWLADRQGGARVTVWVFALMIVGVFCVLHFLPQHGQGGNFYGFLGSFMGLFVLSGIGNASTFRMIPVIFRTLHERWSANGNTEDKAAATRQAGIESAAVIGFSSAIGAYGGFFIPKSYGSSIAWTGGPEMALYGFVVFYASCLAVTWWWYFRRGAETPC